MSSFLSQPLGLPSSRRLVKDLDLDNIPALQPPEGVVSNLVDPPNRNALVMTVTILCLVITTILVFIRAWSRLVVMKIVRIEDCES